VPKKYFTLDQANKTLPLVRKIVTDITALHPVWRDLVYRYELVAAQSDPKWGESTEQVALRTQIEAVARQINGYMVELEELAACSKASRKDSSISTASSTAARCSGAGSRAKSGSATGTSWRPASRAASRFPNC